MTLIRYVEIWVRDSDEQQLSLAGACRPGRSGELIRTETTTVQKGEGFVGGAWNQRSASIVQENPSEIVDRYRELSGEKLIALIAIPIFLQTEIQSVVVLGLGRGYGAAELWTREERDELSVSLSYYSGLKSLEFINRHVRFPKGGGIPGRVWKSGLPQVVDNLSTNVDCVSTFTQDQAEISAAVGLPLGSEGGFPSAVLLLLSDKDSPLADSIELWECETRSDTKEENIPCVKINRIFSISRNSDDSDRSREIPPESWQQTICDQVAASRSPILLETSEIEPPCGFAFLLAIPVFRVQALVGILNLMFAVEPLLEPSRDVSDSEAHSD